LDSFFEGAFEPTDLEEGSGSFGISREAFAGLETVELGYFDNAFSITGFWASSSLCNCALAALSCISSCFWIFKALLIVV
jgi:hypothetical protein